MRNRTIGMPAANAVIRSKRASMHDEDVAAHELLDELITTPIVVDEPPLPPTVLRSTDEQRQLALSPFLLRTWLDHTLQQAEWLLVLATVVFFSYWLIDGYGRDWWHELQASAAQPTRTVRPTPLLTPVPTSPAAPSAEIIQSAASLPFTTPDMKDLPELGDYLVPRYGVHVKRLGDPNPNRLVIPAIGLDTPVVEVRVVDGVWQVADYAAGYHYGSALPGDVGNTVMAGHAGLRGGVFRDLGNLSLGDEITVETAGWRYGYRVREMHQVLPTEIEVMAPTPTAVLTLITCTAWDTQRLIVVADLVDARPLGSG